MHGERIRVNSLIEALALGGREHIALVGGGGKTTLMFALAEELRRNGRRVVASTTTKVRRSEAQQYETVLTLESDGDWKTGKTEELINKGLVFVGRRILESGKIEGISASAADEIFQDSSAQVLIVEADGAAGHPLKAPAEHEPVIPISSTMVVAMMGLEAIGARLEDSTTFRLDQVIRVTGLEHGAILTPIALAGVFLHPAGLFKGTPENARRIVFLNKADIAGEKEKAEELANFLLGSPSGGIDRLVLGSLKEGVYRVGSGKGRQ